MTLRTSVGKRAIFARKAALRAGSSIWPIVFRIGAMRISIDTRIAARAAVSAAVAKAVSVGSIRAKNAWSR